MATNAGGGGGVFASSDTVKMRGLPPSFATRRSSFFAVSTIIAAGPRKRSSLGPYVSLQADGPASSS